MNTCRKELNLDSVIAIRTERGKRGWLRFVIGVALSLMLTVPEVLLSQGKGRGFTVADDIALTQIHATDPNQPYDYATVSFSPDSKYFLVLADRGRLDLNKVESIIRIYRVKDVADFLSHPENMISPAPLSVVSKATFQYGPIITDVRWVPDSSAVVFLAKNTSGNDQLFLADIQGRTIKPLTCEREEVTGFDVQSERRFVYAVLSPAIREKLSSEKQAAVTIGTGHSLYDLIYPAATHSSSAQLHDLSELWAFAQGKRFRVVDKLSGHPIRLHRVGEDALALSPDGRSVVSAFTVSDVPKEWESLFPPKSPSYPNRVRAGPQNPDALNGWKHVCEYVLIDLHTGKAKGLLDAPVATSVGWPGSSHARWSSDGQSVVLSNTFLPPAKRGVIPEDNTPCVAVADLTAGDVACLDAPEQTASNGHKDFRQRILDGRFVDGSKDRVMATYSLGTDIPRSLVFVRQADGSWRAVQEEEQFSLKGESVELSIKQGIDQPCVLIATSKRTNVSRIIWDPNPQLKDIRLGEASVFKWKDKTGRDWVGGLYKPPDYIRGTRYPLVIQTHAFNEHQFLPSGSYPTTFAAQELAAKGIMVLQVQSCPLRVTPEEGTCQVAGYDAAVKQLAEDGLVDPDRLGIVGFSRGSYYVAETLTTSALKFRAASIADGVTFGYAQYLQNLDTIDNIFAHEAEVLIGPPPFGPGLSRWAARSPLFNIDKVTTPLEVLATTAAGSVLLVWEPYAALRYLHKPVDLVIIKSDEHVFTNPANRLISQGNTVDWFRFWLQGYEDPNPAKADQYARWHELRKLQLENESKAQDKEKAN